MNKHIDFYDALDQVVSIAHQTISDLECNPEQFYDMAIWELEREGADISESEALIEARAKEIQRRYRDSIDAVEKLLVINKEALKSFGGVMLNDENKS